MNQFIQQDNSPTASDEPRRGWVTAPAPDQVDGLPLTSFDNASWPDASATDTKSMFVFSLAGQCPVSTTVRSTDTPAHFLLSGRPAGAEWCLLISLNLCRYGRLFFGITMDTTAVLSISPAWPTQQHQTFRSVARPPVTSD